MKELLNEIKQHYIEKPYTKRGKFYIEALTLEKILFDKVSQLEPPVIQTNMEYYCKECKTICATYEQGLSCSCDDRWETERYTEEDYPDKWIKVKVNIYSV